MARGVLVTIHPQIGLSSPPVLQVRVRQLEGDVEYQILARGADASASDDAAVLHDYFNLSTPMGGLVPQWCAADEKRFAKVHVYFPGAFCAIG